MMTDLIAGRPNLNTASNPTSPLVFPGRSADKHLLASTLRTAAIHMGVDIIGARSGALRQLVLDCPPPVVAEALGYSYQAIDRHAQRAGSPWSSYAALRAQTPCLLDGSQEAVVNHSGYHHHDRVERALLHGGRHRVGRVKAKGSPTALRRWPGVDVVTQKGRLARKSE
jgi:hypothetical protein